jgi:hypothetical protein
MASIQKPGSFKTLEIRLEQNATDGDFEVVIEAAGSDAGLKRLIIISPDGKTVADFTAGTSAVGMRKFLFETPEPKDIDSLKSSFAEGAYIFSGVTLSDENLKGTSTLSYSLPESSTFINPENYTTEINNKGLEISWKPVKNVAAYIVYIEQKELDISLNARFPPTKTFFKVPDLFLIPNFEYQLGLGTVAENGNISFIEKTIKISKL